MHPPDSSPNLVAAAVESVVESGGAVLVAAPYTSRTVHLCNLHTRLATTRSSTDRWIR